MHIPIFGLIMIFVLWLTYELKKRTRLTKQDTEDFWEKERRSGFVPRQNTDDIRFINIDESALPTDCLSGSPLDEAVRGILSLKDVPVADLSEFTNTELKLKYGTANFTKLSEADTHFTSLAQNLGKCISLLYDEGRLAEAEKAALFAADNGIFTTVCIMPLANIYIRVGDMNSLDNLIVKAKNCPRCPATLISKLEALKGDSELSASQQDSDRTM